MADTFDDGDATMVDEQDEAEHDVLIRCTQGEVAKFSAKVRTLTYFFHLHTPHDLDSNTPS